MTARMLIWWRGRTSREQQLLLVMAGLSIIVLVWLLVVRPLDDALAEARERHGSAVVAVAEAREQAASIGRLERIAPGVLAAPLETMVSASATEAGFPIARLEPEGANQTTISIAAARPQAFFAWVGRMEAAGLVVERLSATANSDQTLSVKVTWRAQVRR